MLSKKIVATLCLCVTVAISAVTNAQSKKTPALQKIKYTAIGNAKIAMAISYGNRASVTSLIVNGEKVISSVDGAFTSVKVNGITLSSLHLKKPAVLTKAKDLIKLSGISYGDKKITINENWIFKITGDSIKWTVERKLFKSLAVDEAALPVLNFNSIKTWEGAYQGYGGLAWFYLFNEKLTTYGVHTHTSSFWNSKTGNGLNVAVNAPGKNVTMKYTKADDDRLAYTITVSDKDLLPKLDTGTNRRRYITGRTDVWEPFTIPAGISSQSITFTRFDFNRQYGRGSFKGVDGAEVSAVLNTIARIGVIDSLHFGGNSWHTPYGPICLHEQYIAQLGLAINDPKYLKGYESCLDYYRDHAIEQDGRVYPRWAYTNEDAAPGQFNKDGFYEAQWGELLDSNPDLVTNVAELYDMTGDKNWVKTHQQSCEKALDWILKRDSDGNGLVEMMTDNEAQKKSSDWIDIIWASYENAFVNAKLYHALVKWAAIEHQLNNEPKAKYYDDFAARLKVSFNKSTSNGGFWDEEKHCYVHWIDKDKTVHGRNMVTPVNFMAIAYGICDDAARQKMVLDTIESQMVKENMFFWPIAMSTYAPGEGKRSQYPFPSYENGDIFLSWGSIAVRAYAAYNPALAVKYVKNVLAQYSKDGLAYQRYGRIKQDGLGDDILSGNSLAIVGLYQAVYGINPMYNRLYLDPHITPELAGTVLNYNLRNQKLTVNLDNNSYAVSNGVFKIVCGRNFGFNATDSTLSYFDKNDTNAALDATSQKPLAITIAQWDGVKMEWVQTFTNAAPTPVVYVLHRLKPNTGYTFTVNGAQSSLIKSDADGQIIINENAKVSSEKITIAEK